jgi:hypothetical protein
MQWPTQSELCHTINVHVEYYAPTNPIVVFAPGSLEQQALGSGAERMESTPIAP